MTTLEMEHRLDVQSFEVNKARRGNVASKESFNNIEVHIRLNKRKFVNGLMDVRDSSTNMDMQVFHRHHKTTLEIGNHVHTHSQTTKEMDALQLWSLIESWREVRRQNLIGQRNDVASSSCNLPIPLDNDSELD